MDDKAIELAAVALAEVRLTQTPVPELPVDCRPASIEDGYAVQARLNALLSERGLGAPVGYKIGCTTKTLQAYLKIDHPSSGVIFDSLLKQRHGRFERAELCNPGVECEIAVTLGRDLDQGDVDLKRAANAVATAHASIELVDARWSDYANVSTPTLVADNFFGAGCVIGPAVEIDPIRLESLHSRIAVDGEEIGSGVGGDILGHPLNALAWLAKRQADACRPLRAGDVVTLGSMVNPFWFDGPALVEMSVDELGGCSLDLV